MKLLDLSAEQKDFKCLATGVTAMPSSSTEMEEELLISSSESTGNALSPDAMVAFLEEVLTPEDPSGEEEDCCPFKGSLKEEDSPLIKEGGGRMSEGQDTNLEGGV